MFSLFRKHDHHYMFVSAEDITKKEFDPVTGVSIVTDVNTIVVDMCFECKSFRTRYLDGHHAARVENKYKELSQYGSSLWQSYGI